MVVDRRLVTTPAPYSDRPSRDAQRVLLAMCEINLMMEEV